MKPSQHVVREAIALTRQAAPVVHPFNPEARRQTLSLGDATGLTGIGIHLNVIAPGDATTELHRHSCVDEFIYILAGQATVHLDAETRAVTAGDFIGLPANGPAHAMRNTGTTDLVYLVGGNRPDFDVCDYPQCGRRLYVVATQDGRRHEWVNCADIHDA